MSEKNLYDSEAVKKLKELTEGKICMFSTALDQRPIPSRPMQVQEVNDEGIMWFISNKDSDHHYQLEKDSELQLFFAATSKNEYVSVYGVAEIYTDQNTIDEHWKADARAWFDEGKDDPKVSIIGVKPKDVKYWDSKHGTLIDSAITLFGMITGKDIDDEAGEQGQLNV